ncbi:MAG: GNAT family N-acetyltransferase [Candidatus Omnitrophica bacterium]|nr:GNAT family N-acetyltransferase [Candidatus Omnitrophota bacterium]
MIKKCTTKHFRDIYEIINDAAFAYKGVIPKDRWHEPYMSEAKLRKEIESGVVFYGFWEKSVLLGIMGIQALKEVTLIRHAYVRTENRRRGIGGRLLGYLCRLADNPVLIGTWKAADWAIGFYQKHGFELIEPESAKNALLNKYWKIPQRQVITSVVMQRNKRQAIYS